MTRKWQRSTKKDGTTSKRYTSKETLFPNLATIEKCVEQLMRLHRHDDWSNTNLGMDPPGKYRLKTHYAFDEISGYLLKARSSGVNAGVRKSPSTDRAEKSTPQPRDNEPRQPARKAEFHYLVPMEHAHALLLWAHLGDSGKHRGRDNTFERIKETFSPEGFCKDLVNDWIALCPMCGSSGSRKPRPSRKRKRGEDNCED
jgi:hypothetical protein